MHHKIVKKIIHATGKILFIYLFGVLRRFQHCTGHITTGSWKGRGNQYIQFVRVLYCKLLTNGKQLPAFPLEAMPGTEPRPHRWEARVLPLCHRGPFCYRKKRSKLIFMGDHAFSVVTPKYWNKLPDVIKSIELLLDIFKKKLKTLYFTIAYC